MQYIYACYYQFVLLQINFCKLVLKKVIETELAANLYSQEFLIMIPAKNKALTSLSSFRQVPVEESDESDVKALFLAGIITENSHE